LPIPSRDSLSHICQRVANALSDTQQQHAKEVPPSNVLSLIKSSKKGARKGKKLGKKENLGKFLGSMGMWEEQRGGGLWAGTKISSSPDGWDDETAVCHKVHAKIFT
jgi:hypothetical protein